MHTNLGDLKIELFCELIPKNTEVGRKSDPLNDRTFWHCVRVGTTTIPNSTGLHKESYRLLGIWKDLLFREEIPQVVLLLALEVGTGKGGESITGNPVEDEFHPSIKVGQEDRLSVVRSSRNGGDGQETSQH